MARVMSELSLRLFSAVFAAGDPNPTPSGALTSPPPEIDPLRVTPGMWGFISFIFLIVVAILLYFSLRKQLRRVDFDESATVPDQAPGSRDADPRIES